MFYLVLVCVLQFIEGITLLSETNHILTQLITKGDVLLRLQCLGLYNLRLD
jgi:hypothetical protein